MLFQARNVFLNMFFAALCLGHVGIYGIVAKGDTEETLARADRLLLSRSTPDDVRARAIKEMHDSIRPISCFLDFMIFSSGHHLQ